MSQQDSLFKEPAPGREATAARSSTPFSASQPSDSDVAAQLKTAQRQVSNLLVMLLVVSGTFSIYLFQEVRYDRANLAVLAPQAQQQAQANELIATYNQKSVPAMQNFFTQLGEYSKTHPDVLPILAKYGLVQQKPQAAGVPPAQTP